jgi:hypothetical protein
MRHSYLRTSKLISLVILFVFIAEYFLDKPSLRSSHIDLERQIDLAFARQEKKGDEFIDTHDKDLNENNNQVVYFIV